MKNNSGGIMKKVLLILVLVVFSTVFLTADVYIQQKIHSDAFEIMGQKTPEKNEVSHMWLGKNKMAMHGEKMSIIINLDKKEILMINHENKSYVPMSLPLELDKYFPAQMLQMMGGVKVTVNPTGETLKVGKWKCQGYDMSMNMMMFTINSKIWASTDVFFDWKKFQEGIFMEFSKVTMRLDEDTVKEFQKIKGFQIKSVMTINMMGQDMVTTQEVVEISKKSAPAGTYSAPAGYTKKDKVSMMDMQNR
jgi:hypothetical protein